MLLLIEASYLIAMKYPKTILLKITMDDYHAIKGLADIRRGSIAQIARQAIADLLQREGMDPMSKQKTPSQIAG